MNQPKQEHKTSVIFFPLTIRGLIIISLAIYFLAGPVRLHSDIIAAGFSVCTLASLALFLGLAFLLRRRLQKSLAIELSVNTEDDQTVPNNVNFAGDPITLVAKISGISISPFFELRLRFIFKQDINTETHSLGPSCPKQTFISESIIFPHRGNWAMAGISLQLLDRLGFTKIRLPFWILQHEIKVDPKPFHCPRWPIAASTIRVDDQISHPVERKGDLYDLKQYHPSDGARKIVWKLFAKSGQLFSRYPEPAFSPEGKVAFLCLAKKTDDKLASETVAYLMELEKLDIEIIFTTLSPIIALAKSVETAKNLLIAEAWNSEATNSSDVKKLLEALVSEVQGKNNHSLLQSLILGVSEDSLIDPSYRNLVESSQLFLSQNGIRSTIFMSSCPDGILKNPGITHRSHFFDFLSAIKRLFLNYPESEKRKVSLDQAKVFISTLNPNSSDLVWS